MALFASSTSASSGPATSATSSSDSEPHEIVEPTERERERERRDDHGRERRVERRGGGDRPGGPPPKTLPKAWSTTNVVKDGRTYSQYTHLKVPGGPHTGAFATQAEIIMRAGHIADMDAPLTRGKCGLQVAFPTWKPAPGMCPLHATHKAAECYSLTKEQGAGAPRPRAIEDRAEVPRLLDKPAE